MVRTIMSCGPLLWPMLLVTIVIIVMTVATAIQLSGGRRDARLKGTINVIPVWGAVALLLGILGQAVGLFKASSVVARAHMISPQRVFLGFSEAIQTTILGLMILIVAILAWIVLDAVWRKMAATTAT